MFKYSAAVTFAILLSTAPVMAGSLFDTPGSNPATNRCELYDPNCKPRQLFVRPPEPNINKNPLGKPAPKFILPRDLNDRSGDTSPTLLLPREPSRFTRTTLTCSEARRIIRHEGYRSIRTLKCGGKYYQFVARKFGAKFPVNLKVRATTGKIVVVGRMR
ncbi:MAG: hypothetical protein ABI705_08865 [Aestuariivirga sp.]